MSESIKWMFNVQVKGGPTVTAAGSASTDAYEKTQITVLTGATGKVVNVPVGAQMLVVTSSAYPDPAGAGKLTYKINDAGTAIDLNAPLLLFGQGAVEKFATGLTSLSFTSTLTQDVTIDILVALDATP